MRLNCLDSLDRTNVTMSRVAWDIVKSQLEQFGINIDTTLDDAPSTEFQALFKETWADNGDWLSRHYTGTDSTLSGGTRTMTNGSLF